LPLKAGLGRLLVLGDDALALEVAWLAARTGLSVTWLTAQDQEGPGLDEALLLADFDLKRLPAWENLTAEQLREMGLREGVRLVVTTAQHHLFLSELKEAQPGYLALVGEAEADDDEADSPAGLFPRPLTTAQKALGLVAEMLRSKP
jgi:NADPH-dependent 2,4-dienoyl-CoA reductase/sulfur reductase-like enzyme